MDKAANLEEKNFRSSYYEKVGFRSVDEKKALETILKENPFDIRKLTNHCLKFILPENTRQRIWTLLLDLQPPTDEYVTLRKKYMDIVRSSFHLIVPDKKSTLGKNVNHLNAKYTWEITENKFHLTYYPDLDDETISFGATFHLYVLYWLMGEGQFSHKSLGNHLYVKKNVFECMSQVPSMLANFFNEENELYFACNRVFKIIQNIHLTLELLIHHSVISLEREDRELYVFLSHTNSWAFVPLDDWILSCFLNICQTSALYPLLDKVFAGSTLILVYMTIATLSKFKEKIMLCKESGQFNELFKSKLNPKDSETVVMRAIELWQQNGTLLFPAMKCSRCSLLYNDKKCCLREEMPEMFEFDDDHDTFTKHKFCTHSYTCLTCFTHRNDKVEEPEIQSKKTENEQDNKETDESSESVVTDTGTDPEISTADILVPEDSVSVDPLPEDSVSVDPLPEDHVPENSATEGSVLVDHAPEDLIPIEIYLETSVPSIPVQEVSSAVAVDPVTETLVIQTNNDSKE